MSHSNTPDSNPARAGSQPRSFSRSTSKIKFDTSDAFQKTLKARIDRYFRLTRRSPRDCPQMYAKSAIIFGWFVLSYILLVFVAAGPWSAVALAASLGMSIAAIGFNIQHDGGHKAYSRRNWVNRLMAMTLDLLGASSYMWDRKHNGLHHTYANITDHDDDIDVGFLARLSPHQRRLAFHRLQHLYMWVLYGLLTIKWQLFDDFWSIATGRVGSHRFARPRGRDLAVFIGGKAAFLLLAFGIPAMRHPITSVLLTYVAVSCISGILLSVVFQLAHVVEEAGFPLPDQNTGRMQSDWAVHQVQTTVDFARGNRVLSWLLGGLNFQIEHHLFPRICHVHYPRISRMVEKACRQFGLRYNAHRNLFAGVVSHFRWLQRMGRPESVASE